MRTIHWLRAALLFVVLLPHGLQAQTAGSITGVVVDQATQRGIPGAHVSVAGTQRAALTNQEGRYVLTAVPVGTHDVRVSVISYAQGTQSVTVAAGESATLDFTLAASAIQLEGVVITAAGREERRRELGNSTGNISMENVDLAAVNNMASALQGRTPGVSVTHSGGTSGSGARVRIRGSNSVSLANEPLLIVDGVRVNNSAASMSVATGGQSPSRLNDFNPEDIESIEIVKGPAAAALYGTAAANGVIQITTKRGRAGDVRWNVYSELGSIRDRTKYHDNAADEEFCTVWEQAEGDCTPGTLFRDNPLMDSELRPFIDGSRRKFGMNVSGGSERTAFYLSAETDREQGIFEINKGKQRSVRANLTTQLTDRLNLSLRTGYLDSFVEMPQNDNNTAGVHLNGNLGLPRDHPLGNTGWWWQTPEQIFVNESEQEIRRLTGGVNLDFQPLPWLSLVGTAGIDRFTRHDNQFVAPGLITISANAFDGTRTSNRAEVTNLTGTIDAAGRFLLTPSIVSTTSVGTQYHRDNFHDTQAFGVGIVPGTRSLDGATKLFAVAENTTENVTVGTYVSQQFGFNDRVFLTGAVRADKNSAFGTNIGWVAYPSASASWVISEEEFFPVSAALSSFRLRSAFGRSGLRPSFRDAIVFFEPTPVRSGDAELPGITLAGAGNPNLKPEIATEFEVGFDAGFINDRVGLDVTYYNKQSKDALIQRLLAPSIGATPSRFENIGSVSNTGFEAALNARIIETSNVAWDATATFATNRNELKELGEGVEPIIFGLGSDTQRHEEGYPLGGYWQPSLTWEDANGDGLVQLAEVEEGDDYEYVGTPFPRREASFNTGVTFFDVVRVSGLLDYKGGHKLYNFTRGDRCAWEMVCEETYNIDAASVSDQLGWIGFNLFGRNVSEFIEDADFVKLRELSVSILVPDQYLSRLRVSGARLTLAGRNLATWTKYSGYDPEVNQFGQANFSTADYHNTPPVRHYTIRLDLNF